ncbi:MAG: hydroxymethylglutaryl-CoA lyase, partial [Myxococcota bacterium]|nr:hydroxymethylglutaryl-CoA lyase [Myxococcota bacterium]
MVLTEVGPRDGLQNEQAAISTEDKIAFVDALSAAGHRQIEVSSFVRSDRVPAMADADAVFRGITRRPGVRYVGLVANRRGLERAQEVACDAIALFTATSSTFTEANIGMNVSTSLSRYARLAGEATQNQMTVRGYVSTIFACPYDGQTPPEEVLRVAESLLDMGCDEVSLGDTTGVGTPVQ